MCYGAIPATLENRNTLKCCSEHDCDGSLLQVGSCSSVTRCGELLCKIVCSKYPSGFNKLPRSWDHTACRFAEPVRASPVAAVYVQRCRHCSLHIPACVYPSAAEAFSVDLPHSCGAMKCWTLLLVRKHPIPKRIVFFLAGVKSKQTQNRGTKLRVGLLGTAPGKEGQGWTVSSWRAVPGLILHSGATGRICSGPARAGKSALWLPTSAAVRANLV